jgi:hypothetical protein
VSDFIRIMMGLVFLFLAKPVLAQDSPVPDQQPPASAEELKAEEKEIAEMAEMLKLMELLENMELMEDMDILGGEDTNENKD